MSDDLSPHQIQDIEKMLSSPSDLPSEFTTWWTEWLAGELQPQVLALGGAKLVFFKAAPVIVTSESTASGTFVDLATVGPTLDKLANGRWLFFWGFVGEAVTGTPQGAMGIDVNGGGADSAYVARTAPRTNGDFATSMMAQLLSVNGNDDNTITAKYKAISGTATFRYRWLAGVRIGNV